MGKLRHVFKDGDLTEIEYETLCRDLGFSPESGFVVVTTRGTITFSIGKPSEIKELYAAVMNGGYQPSRKFKQRVETL